MDIVRHASVTWSGGARDGKGAISTESGALHSYPYGFASRFEGQPGSNPEELIAAAHAGCFTMALAVALARAGHSSVHLETGAAVTLKQVGAGYDITASHLTLKARIPGIDQKAFQEIAGGAKAGCPVSKLLKAEVTLDASLEA